MRKVEEYVADINANLGQLQGKHGPWSKYILPNGTKNFISDEGSHSGSLILTWLGHPYEAIACDITSPGYLALRDATAEAAECLTF